MPFDRAFLAMPQEILLPWTSAGGTQEAKKKSQARQKTAYVCHGCEAKVWGKRALFITCGECEVRFEEQTE